MAGGWRRRTGSRVAGRRAVVHMQLNEVSMYCLVDKRTWDDNVGLVAAGVAFYGFFALLSLLGLIVLAYGFVADPLTVIEHMQALTAVLPSDVAFVIGDQLMNAVGLRRKPRVSGFCSRSSSRPTEAPTAPRR